MNTLFIIVGIAVVVFLIYVFTSHSNFASAIRALFQKKEQDAADAVDKVDSRVAAARSAQEGTVKKGRASLYSIQQQLAEVDVELGHTNSEIADDKAALAKAHQNNDRGAFDALVLELNRDTAHQNSLVDTRAEIVAQLKTLEVSVDELEVFHLPVGRDQAKFVVHIGSRFDRDRLNAIGLGRADVKMAVLCCARRMRPAVHGI